MAERFRMFAEPTHVGALKRLKLLRPTDRSDAFPAHRDRDADRMAAARGPHDRGALLRQFVPICLRAIPAKTIIDHPAGLVLWTKPAKRAVVLRNRST